MKLPLIILKATLLSTVIFWVILFLNGTDSALLIYIVPSMIPISICNTIVITCTIAPFFWSKNDNTSYQTVFKTYFPYYALICFSLCVYGTFQEPVLLCFYAAAFISTLQTWVWIVKHAETKKVETLKIMETL